MERGLFFVFEGTEGSGKSTQIRLLAERFRLMGLPCIATREPGGTAIGEYVRSIILSENFPRMNPRTEALLHAAARSEHVGRVITPHLEQGTHVLSDRFFDSTFAYQGGGSGIPLTQLESLQRFAIGDFAPDLRILLLTSIEIGLRRRFGDNGPTNRIDREELGFHERVADAFISMARNAPDRWIVIDGEQAPDAVSESVVQAIDERYPHLRLQKLG